jgi:alkanesulfonate monooxygenase SsuD/methylene tetrahydromethanopterin reductase-like flavin-dependent oxidoreductase (luciferase family)
MEFGVLFTSHPNHATEPYPHRAVHARVTAEIQAADRLGYDTAWAAEHHFWLPKPRASGSAPRW